MQETNGIRGEEMVQDTVVRDVQTGRCGEESLLRPCRDCIRTGLQGHLQAALQDSDGLPNHHQDVQVRNILREIVMWAHQGCGQCCEAGLVHIENTCTQDQRKSGRPQAGWNRANQLEERLVAKLIFN